jgi:hypothetical protein
MFSGDGNRREAERLYLYVAAAVIDPFYYFFLFSSFECSLGAGMGMASSSFSNSSPVKLSVGLSSSLIWFVNHGRMHRNQSYFEYLCMIKITTQ